MKALQNGINLALVSGAHYLVSRDNDLLDLGRQDEEFKTRFPDLTVIDPIGFLELMREAEPCKATVPIGEIEEPL